MVAYLVAMSPCIAFCLPSLIIHFYVPPFRNEARLKGTNEALLGGGCNSFESC